MSLIKVELNCLERVEEYFVRDSECPKAMLDLVIGVGTGGFRENLDDLEDCAKIVEDPGT